MIEKQNFKNLALKIVEGPGQSGWLVDMYSHFKRMRLLQENNKLMMIDLRKYYTWNEGWAHDYIPEIIYTL